jgi:hypothetical protein
MTEGKKYVPFSIFTWAISVLTVIMGWMLVANAALTNKVDAMNESYVSIQTQLSQIQTDLGWIKTNIK